jgi:hypothetical protein
MLLPTILGRSVQAVQRRVNHRPAPATDDSLWGGIRLSTYRRISRSGIKVLRPILTVQIFPSPISQYRLERPIPSIWVEDWIECNNGVVIGTS